jgi:hypothetical protein
VTGSDAAAVRITRRGLIAGLLRSKGHALDGDIKADSTRFLAE